MYRAARNACLAGIVLLAACVESPTSPANDRALQPQFSSQLTPVQWVPNTAPYRNPAHKFATGRSGLATLSARALLGKDGRTTFDISTGDVNANTAGTQRIQKLQLKVFDRVGEVMGTRNDNGLDVTSKSYDLAGLSPHQLLQVQANVLVPNVTDKNNRTGVITLSEPVLLRPDLSVSATVPPQAIVNLPVTVVADVRELNDQVSAHADCVLYVDGVAVDRAPHIFVGEGDIVSCRFSHTFTAIGDHQVSVAAENVMPGDWDVANNSSTPATIRIRGGDYRPLQGSWSVSEAVNHRYFRRYGQDYDVWYAIQSWDYVDYWEDETSDVQSISLSAYVYETLGFPLSADLSISSDGTPLLAYAGPLIDYGWDPDYGGCADMSGPSRLYISVCDYGGGYNEVSMGLTAGTVVYAAQGYWTSRTVINGYDFGWHTNRYSGHIDDYGPKLQIGNQVSLSLVIRGTQVAYGTDQSGTLVSSSYGYSSPYSCRPTSIGQWCEANSQSSTGRSFGSWF